MSIMASVDSSLINSRKLDVGAHNESGDVSVCLHGVDANEPTRTWYTVSYLKVANKFAVYQTKLHLFVQLIS